MVARYRPRSNITASMPAAARIARSSVGRASIKKSTLDRVRREGKELRKNVRTQDAFQNFGLNIGLGTNNALSQSQYGFFPVTRVRTLLEWIHRGSCMGGMAIDLLADDMTRGGVEILAIDDPSQIQKMLQAMTRLQVWRKFASTIKWAQLYGGALAVLLIDGADPSKPLRIESIGKNQFKGLMVLDRWMVDPDLSHLVSEFGPHLGQPEWYTVVADAPAMRGQRIHYTRVVRLIGVELPYYQNIMENLWGLSVYERIYDRMVAYDSATMGAAQLAYKAYLRTYKLKGLHDAMTTAGDAFAGIAQRVEVMRKWQGIEGMTLLDSEDDFATHETSSFTGMADLLVHFAEQLSGALQIPLVRMLGQSPAGLNSTGESDLRTYYDNILQRQERELREGVNTVLRVLAMSLSIKLPDSFDFNFVPLWQLDQTEKTDVADKSTRFVLEAEAGGLISQKVALQELKQTAKVTGFWTNIDDKMIEEANDVAEPPEVDGAEGESGEEGGTGEEGQGEEGGEGQEGGVPKGKTPAESELEGLEEAKKIRRAVGGGGDSAGRRLRALDQLPFSEIGGLQIVIEQRAGTIRRGNGWAVVMPADYGYIRRVPSAEGAEEWLDCFIGPYHSSRDVWVVDAVDPETDEFDEHKVLLGFRTAKEATDCFRKAYDDGAARRVGAITKFDMSSLDWKNFLASHDMTKPLAFGQRDNIRRLRAVA